MKAEQWLPLVMVVLAVGASWVYAWHGDWRHSVYWLAAAALTSTVTF